MNHFFRACGVCVYMIGLVVLCGCARDGATKKPNVLMIAADDLNNDLGCYGHPLDTSPNVDNLARGSLLFERAFSTSSWTLPAHASLFTGKFPRTHGARYDAEGPLVLTSAIYKASPGLQTAIAFGLALSAFPGACFSSFIAANSFKTVMPRVNPVLSVGIGAIVSIILAITGLAGTLPQVFNLIGASFGPICGAMVADYYLANKRWAGPRAGFNVPGWGAWLLGFLVGITPQLHERFSAIPAIPAAPVAADSSPGRKSSPKFLRSINST